MNAFNRSQSLNIQQYALIEPPERSEAIMAIRGWLYHFNPAINWRSATWRYPLKEAGIPLETPEEFQANNAKEDDVYALYLIPGYNKGSQRSPLRVCYRSKGNLPRRS